MYILVRCRLDPELAPPYDVGDLGWRERIVPFLKYVLPLMSIFVVVVGSILGGFATPTESAALGAMGSLAAAAALYRRLTWASFLVAMRQTPSLHGHDPLHHLRGPSRSPRSSRSRRHRPGLRGW